MLLIKTYNTLRSYGLVLTVKTIINYLFNKPVRTDFVEKVLEAKNIEDKFTWIYDNNYWGYESASGAGSTLKYTENIQKELPKLISRLNIKIVLDAPCGDFNWMRILLPKINVKYIGADIVQSLVDVNNKKYKNRDTKFIKLDLISQTFPAADLMICRDCLFHLSFNDISMVLQNFLNSDIKYLLTTNFKNDGIFENIDIKTGDFRCIDLFSSPFNFPNDPIVRIDDWVAPDPERELCLFSKEQVELVFKSNHKFSIK
jgi:hypothetical protein